MNNTNIPAETLNARRSLKRRFKAKGVTLGVLSGISCGLFSTFVIIGQGHGEWADWYGDNNAGLSFFAITFIIGIMGSGINDACSGIWTLIIAAGKGKLGDFGRCVKSKPGVIVMVAAVIGGCGAGGTYIVALQLGGSSIVPFAALCPAIGAVLARIFFKQDLSVHKVIGIIIYISATIMIGSTGMTGDAKPGMILGCMVAFVTALCWAIEGVVVGYTVTLMDYEIGIAIRQCTSGVVNLLIIIPILCLIDGQTGLYSTVLGGALGDWSAMKFFIISGFFDVFAYSLWYKGNNMCGAALGLAANGAYSFWTPFFCFTIAGLVFGQPGWEMPVINWIAAVLMVVGIAVIAINPKSLFKKGGEENVTS
ncbi:MAG: hypothetical protein VB031_03925 [Eubacteriaceae bacterium]|nr:hypothetical protein [Eubacteriaceae bacterium]